MIFTQHSLHMSCDRRKRKVGVRFPPPPPRISTPSKNKQKFFYLIFFFWSFCSSPTLLIHSTARESPSEGEGVGSGRGKVTGAKSMITQAKEKPLVFYILRKI